MTDKKLTDSEIVKALECCIESNSCSKCPFANIADIRICTSKMSKNALDLINRQKADLIDKEKQLQEALKSMAVNKTKVIDCEREIDCQKSEIEKLKPFENKIAGFNSHIRVEDMLVFASSLEEWLEFCENLKAEAYKEFAEMIDKTTWYHINKNGELVQGANSETDIPLYKAEDVHNLLKERVGE